MAYEDLSEAFYGYPLSKVVVFDTETTGFSPKDGDELLSISICNGYGASLFSTYIRPKRKRSWKAAEKVNGITPAMVRDAPIIDEVAERIRHYLTGQVLVVGYNTYFDLNFLMSAGVIDCWPMAVVDVMREYAEIHSSDQRWVKLTEAANCYGYVFHAHDAEEDAKATAWVYRAMIADEAYCALRLGNRLELIKHPHISQTKETTTNIMKLVGEGKTVGIKATLKLGRVTRGKTKGQPRYECYVEDERVGVSSPGEVFKIREWYQLSEDDNLPEEVPCKASLASTPTNASCEVTITAQNYIHKLVHSMAETYRSATKSVWRPAKKESINVQERAGSTTVATTSTSAKKDRKKDRKKVIVIVIILCLALSFCGRACGGQDGEGASKAALVMSRVTVLLTQSCSS